MQNKASLRIVVRGRVQGVNFRAFVRQHAHRLELTGFVRNLADGTSVEVLAEGPWDRLQQLLAAVQKGPRAARVDQVETTWGEGSGAYRDFQVCLDW